MKKIIEILKINYEIYIIIFCFNFILIIIYIKIYISISYFFIMKLYFKIEN